MGLTSIDVVCPKATEFCDINQNKGHYAVQGHSRSPILVQMESLYATSYVWITVTYTFYLALFPIYGELRHWSNFRCLNWLPLFNAIVRRDSLISVLQNFGLRQLETPLYRTMQSIFRYLEPSRRDSRVWQTRPEIWTADECCARLGELHYRQMKHGWSSNVVDFVENTQRLWRTALLLR